MLAKMRGDLGLQGLDLGVEGLQDRDCRADGGRVGGGDDLGLAQMLGAKPVLDRGGFAGDVTATGLLGRR